MTTERLAALLHNDYDCIHYDPRNRSQWQCWHKAEKLVAQGVRVGDPPPPADDAGGLRAALEAIAGDLDDADRPLIRVDRMRAIARAALAAQPAPTLDRGEAAAREFVDSITLVSIDRERLANAIDNIAWPESESPLGYSSGIWVRKFAAAIADAYEADGA